LLQKNVAGKKAQCRVFFPVMFAVRGRIHTNGDEVTHVRKLGSSHSWQRHPDGQPRFASAASRPHQGQRSCADHQALAQLGAVHPRRGLAGHHPPLGARLALTSFDFSSSETHCVAGVPETFCFQGPPPSFKNSKPGQSTGFFYIIPLNTYCEYILYHCHCERSEAISLFLGLLRYARNDRKVCSHLVIHLSTGVSSHTFFQISHQTHQV
jgi:hypothetical protein